MLSEELYKNYRRYFDGGRTAFWLYMAVRDAEAYAIFEAAVLDEEKCDELSRLAQKLSNLHARLKGAADALSFLSQEMAKTQYKRQIIGDDVRRQWQRATAMYRLETTEVTA